MREDFKNINSKKRVGVTARASKLLHRKHFSKDLIVG